MGRETAKTALKQANELKHNPGKTVAVTLFHTEAAVSVKMSITRQCRNTMSVFLFFSDLKIISPPTETKMNSLFLNLNVTLLMS